MTEAAAAYVRDAVLQTIGIAASSFVIAVVLAIPLALLLARGGRIGAAFGSVLTAVRAIPELVLAIVAVVAVGLGSVAGIVALSIHYAAVLAKLWAEILGSVRREAAEALRATGSTAATAFLVGLLPPAWSGIVGFAAYGFESIVRGAVIVGVVGAGGLGAALLQALNLADYGTFTLILVVLTILVILVDAVAERLRLRAPPLAVGVVFASLVAIAIVTLAFGDDQPWRQLPSAPEHLAAFVRGSLPPDFSPTLLGRAGFGIAETLGVAFAGTLAGIVLALPFAVFAATPLARGWMRGTGWRPWSLLPEYVSRAVLAATRAIPPIALALIGLTFVGLGPKAGIFALALHTGGVLGKLLAESLELAVREPAEALVATGATAVAAVGVGLLPAALPAMVAHVLYRFEWNVRASTVLGMVGAGGIGQAIFNAQQLLFYRQLLAYVLLAVGLVIAVDAAGARLRNHLSLQTMEI